MTRNLMIVITAGSSNHRCVVARCSQTRNAEKLRKAGADAIVSPDFTGGMRIVSAMIRPHRRFFLDEMLKSEKTFGRGGCSASRVLNLSRLAFKFRSANYVLFAVREWNGNWQFNPDESFLLKPGLH